MPEDWRSALTFPLHKGKGEKNECKNYRCIGLLSMIGKIFAGILVDRVRRMTWGLIDNEKMGFTAGSECVDQIFTLKQIGEKAREKKCRVYVGFVDLEEVCDRVNRETL